MIITLHFSLFVKVKRVLLRWKITLLSVWRVHLLLIYDRQRVWVMQQDADNLNDLSFEDFTASGSATIPSWANKSMTKLAHSTGKLPERASDVGWQPWHRPGTPLASAMTSSTIRSLTRKAQLLRGEA
jgi:hypothetical protein